MTRKQKRLTVRIAAAAVLVIVAALLPLEGWARLAAFIVPYLAVGGGVLWSAVRNLFRGQVFDEKLLMSIATIGAFCLGDYPEAVAVMVFYQIGELFESIAVGRSRKSIAALMDIRPDSAVVLRDGEEMTVSPDEVSVGETLIIRPGDRIPLDGEIIEGETAVNTAALTGESLPADKRPGDKVVSGTINLSGVIRVRAESAFAESTVSRILELVESSAEKKARVEGFITRFARVYTPCVVFGALLLGLIPPLLLAQPWGVWIERALIFLVVSCPCALVVSVPLTFFGGIGSASREGVLIKGASYLETLSKVGTVVFDKTGTLTYGSFAVEEMHPSDVTEAQLLDIAAAADSRSNHPIAESIIEAHGGHIDPQRVGAVTEHAGMGVEATIDGETCFVGNEKLMELAGAERRDCHLTGTVVHISRGSRYLGHIVVNDRLKPDASKAVTELRELGVERIAMLTGDNERTAQAIGLKAGIDDIHAGLFPAQKVGELEGLMGGRKPVAFVGDGINDAPVLTRADVGIAMGALGSDAAIEAADIVLMDDKPSRIASAIRLSRRTMRIVRENIVFALGAKGLMLALSALGFAGMWLAVFSDVGVLIIAVLNAMRTLRPTHDKAKA